MSNESPKTTVLVADDDAILRRLLERTLTRRGYKVITAEDGQAALTVVAQRKTTGITIDAVITDTEMPKMSGTQLASVLKQQGISPVIAMSGKDMKDAYEGRGIYTFVNKPFSISEITQILDEALNASEADTDPIEAVKASTLEL